MRRTPTALVVFLVALAFALLPGCASHTHAPADLAVTLADLRPMEATSFETRVTVTVRFTNQSPQPISLSGSRHILTINGRSVGTAVGAEKIELPALASETREITLNLSNITLLALIRDLQRNPVAVYEIDSTLFASGMFSRSLRSRETGTINLSDLASGPVR